MSGWAATERQALTRLLQEVGPDAPVVPAGWRTAQLAAHLYVRERRPDAAAGVVLPGPFSSYTERVMASALRVIGYEGLVERLAAGPPVYLRPLDDVVNLLEFFVHHEDVRRAGGRPPRDLPVDLEDVLWSRLRRGARLMTRRVHDVRVELQPPRRVPAAVGKGAAVTVSGPVGELVLFAFDRKGVAEVELTGDEAAVRRLRAASLGP